MEVRIQKILAEAGFGSRRSCESFIEEGRVTLDGKVVDKLGTKADPEIQSISLDGEKIAGPGKVSRKIQNQQQKVYYALNKPLGVLCTNDDPSGRILAVNLIPETRRIFCVGRLDKESEGLILLTNDGELTQKLTHPSFGIEKTYLITVEGEVSGAQLEKIQKGVYLAEGKTQGAFARIRKRSKKSSVLEIRIREGMNREIRRMLAAVGMRCRKLKRIRVGPIRLGQMPVGEYREIHSLELKLLRDEIESAQKRKDSRTSTTPQRKRPDRKFRDQGSPRSKSPSTTSGSSFRPWERNAGSASKKKKKPERHR